MDQPTRTHTTVPAGVPGSVPVPSPQRRGRFIPAALLLLAMVALGACGDSGPPATPTTRPQPTSTAALDEPTSAPTERASDGWQTFTSEADGFAVDAPGDLKGSTRTTDSPLGEVIFHFFQLSDGDAQYAVSYNDYPVAPEDLDQEQLLTDAINGAAQGSEVQNPQRIDVQGHPGVDGEATIQGVAHLWYRGVLVNERLYQVIFTAPEANKTDFHDRARRFIGSFTLLDT